VTLPSYEVPDDVRIYRIDNKYHILHIIRDHAVIRMKGFELVVTFRT
jgi:hypothetical protein